MSGGAAEKSAPILLDLFSFREMEQELWNKQDQMDQLTAHYRKISDTAEQYNTLSQQLDLKQHELEMIKNRWDSFAFSIIHRYIT